jgi:hypothetical protein
MDVDDDGRDWSTNLKGVGRLMESGHIGQAAAISANSDGNSGSVDQRTAVVPVEVTSEARQPPEVPASQNTTVSGSGGEAGTGQQTPEVRSGSGSPPNTSQSSAIDQSKEYLRRFKEKKVKELEDSLGDDKLSYNVIQTANKAVLAAPDLAKMTSQKPADMGTFFSEADGRVKLADIQVILGQKKTWTYSFDHTTFECLGCDQHHNRLYFPRRGSTAKGGRQTIWLTDQAMPAVLPVSSHLNCVKIIRLENGSVLELASGLVDLMRGRQIAAGSVVLLTSASNMAAAGTAGYTEDLMAAIRLLRRDLGDHINYGPLPNILFNGASEELIRTNLEVGAWAQVAFRGCDALLKESFVLLEEAMRVRGEGGLQTNYRCRLRLPTAHDKPDKFTTWSSGDWGNFPNKIRPPRTSEEADLYYSIFRELRENLALDLEPEPRIDRWPVMLHTVGDKKKTFLVVGSSHSSRTAAALKRAGYNVDTITKPNWRALKNSVKDLASELAAEINVKLEEKKTDVVVLQLLDSNIYWALQEDGSTISARLGPDKQYHMDGDLITISKSAQHSLFNTLRPIFEVVNKDFLLITPLPRFLVGGCCSDRDHMPNRQRDGFEQQLMSDLRDMASNFKDFLFTSGYKNGKIVDPQISLRGMSKEEMWGADPVHPKDVAYDKLVEGIVKVASNLEDAGKKRRRTDSLDGNINSQRQPHGAGAPVQHSRPGGPGGYGGGQLGGGQVGRVQRRRF